MNRITLPLIFVFAASISTWLSAQSAKDTQNTTKPEKITDLVVQSAATLVSDVDGPQLVIQDRRIPLLTNYFNSGLASNDGQYLAQNEIELQTYYDLGMTYKYIQESYLRKQLNLPHEQGIFVLTAGKSGDGHKNGFRSGDLVLKIGDTAVDTQYDLVIAISENRGAPTKAKIRRNGEDMELVVVLREVQSRPTMRLIIGVFVEEIDELTKAQLGIEGGAAVTQVTDDGPSKSVGVVKNDIITYIDGTLINNLQDLKNVVQQSNGKPIKLDVIRSAKQISFVVTPREVPITDNQLNDNSRYIWSTSLLDTELQSGFYQITPSLLATAATSATQPSANKKPNDQRFDEILKKIGQLENQIKELKSTLKK